MVLNPAQHPGRVWPLGVHPCEGVALIVLAMKNALLQSAKTSWIPRSPHRESVHWDPVEARQPARILIAPRHVVGRAGSHDHKLVLAGELLCDQPRVELGAARDLFTVSLNNKGEAQLFSNACRQRRCPYVPRAHRPESTASAHGVARWRSRASVRGPRSPIRG